MQIGEMVNYAPSHKGDSEKMAEDRQTLNRNLAQMLKGDGVEILATHDGAATAVRWRSIWAFAGHPELTSDRRVFAAFAAAR